MTTYTPAAGTVAARVVAWLQARPTGEYNAAQIAEALKVDPKLVASSLEVALRERLVFHRQRDRTSPRAPWWYSARDREEHARRNGFAAAAAWMPAPKKDSTAGPPAIDGAASEGTAVTPGPSQLQAAPDTSEGLASQQVLKAEVARPDATAREARPTGSPGVGPMGAGQPADAGPTTDESAAQQGNFNPVTDAVEPAAPAALPLHEQRREVDEQFAASLRAAMDFGDDDDALARGAELGRREDHLPAADLATTRRAVRAPHQPAPLAFRAARFTDGTLATERDGIVVAVYSAAEVDAIQKLLGART